MIFMIVEIPHYHVGNHSNNEKHISVMRKCLSLLKWISRKNNDYNLLFYWTIHKIYWNVLKVNMCKNISLTVDRYFNFDQFLIYFKMVNFSAQRKPVKICTPYTKSRWWCSFRCQGPFSAILHFEYINLNNHIKIDVLFAIKWPFVKSIRPMHMAFKDLASHWEYRYWSGLYLHILHEYV